MKKAEPTQPTDVYTPLGHKKLIIQSVIILMVIGFILNFSFEDKIKSTIDSKLSSVRGCDISYREMEISYFFPDVTLKGASLPGSCFKSPGNNINLSSLSFSFAGIGLSPFGPQIKISTNYSDIPINAYLTVGLGTIFIALDETTIDINKVRTLLPSDAQHIAGSLTVEALTEVDGNIMKSVDLSVKSQNFSMKEKDLGLFKLPDLDIGNLSIKATVLGNNTINLKELIIGNSDSPIIGKFQGNIQLNRTLILSPINLEGEIKFSEKILGQLSFIEGAISKYRQESGFYKLKLGGTLGLPTPQ